MTSFWFRVPESKELGFFLDESCCAPPSFHRPAYTAHSRILAPPPLALMSMPRECFPMHFDPPRLPEFILYTYPLCRQKSVRAVSLSKGTMSTKVRVHALHRMSVHSSELAPLWPDHQAHPAHATATASTIAHEYERIKLTSALPARTPRSCQGCWQQAT